MIDALIISSSRDRKEKLDMIDDTEAESIKLDDWMGIKNEGYGGVYNEYRK